MVSIFDIQILLDAFNVMHELQGFFLLVVRFVSVALMFFGFLALNAESKENNRHSIMKRGYGWGWSMIVVSVFLATFEWTVRAFSLALTTNDDPLMMLSKDSDSISSLSQIDVGVMVLAGYASMVGFFFILGGFKAFIRASHRQETGAGAIGRYWFAGIALFYLSNWMTDFIG